MESNSMLDGKVAFITGSTRGIGWATAKVFARHGAKLILNGKSNRDLLNERVAEIEQHYGVECSGQFVDVSNSESLKDCYQEIFRRHKRLDVLVNNAGILRDALLGMISDEAIQQTFATNSVAALQNLQHAARLMSRHNSGSIINVTSIVAGKGNTGQCLYASTKSALIGLTLAAAKELAAQNIRVNAVAPGLVDTDMVKDLPSDKLNGLLSAVGMRRIGQPEEVANVILFLASGLSSYVTGQVLGVDGGLLI